MKLAEFLKNQAKKAGVNVEDESVKAFFETAAFAEIEVPEPVHKPIDTSLISLTDAKNNHSDIKNHYTRQALDGLDKSVDALMDQYGLTEDEKNLIKVERSSYKRPELLIKAIQKAEQAKANADKPDKAAIQKQIDDLHTQLRQEKEKQDGLVKDYAAKEKKMKIGYSLQGLLNSHKTINDSLEPEVRFAIVDALLNKALQDGGAKFDYDENGNFVLIKSDGTNFYGENNQQVNAKQFVEQVLSKNRLLVTTSQQQNNSNSGNGGANGQSSQNGQNGSAPATGSGNKTGANGTFRELMKEAQQSAAQTSPAFGG